MLRKAVRGAALAVGSLFVCLALALAVLVVYGGASATTAAPPGPGPHAGHSERAVSSPVQSSPDLPSPAGSGVLGSGTLAGGALPGSQEAAQGGIQQAASGEAADAEGGLTKWPDAKPPATEGPQTGSSDSTAEQMDQSSARQDPERTSSGGVTDGSGGEGASRPSLGSSEDVAPTPRAAGVDVPEDRTMRLTIPAMARVEGTEVVNAAFDNRAALDESVLHPAGTGFPWERQANVYIAGHRLGYPGTGSFLIFRDLNALTAGDAVFLTDANGREYRYEVFERELVEPGQTSVMEEREGENIVTLQTCTLPDYTQRLIVRAAKVGG